jgi:hypothetical protein
VVAAPVEEVLLVGDSVTAGEFAGGFEDFHKLVGGICIVRAIRGADFAGRWHPLRKERGVFRVEVEKVLGDHLPLFFIGWEN